MWNTLNARVMALDIFPGVQTLPYGVVSKRIVSMYSTSLLLCDSPFVDGKTGVHVVSMTGGQMRSLMQCILPLLIELPNMDTLLIRIWKLLVQLDERLEASSFNEADLERIALRIEEV